MSISFSRVRCRILLFMAALSGMAFSQSQKLPFVAVVPITGSGIEPSALQVVTDGLADELIKTGRVRVMERSQMETILKEQGFQQSGACDGSECAVQIGKLLSIDKMVVGSLGKIGTAYSLSVRAVDVGTGEVVSTSRKMQRGAIDEVVSDLLPTVAAELSASLVKDKTALAPAKNAPGVSAKSEPAPASSTQDGKKNGLGWGWWVAGGVAVAGGAVAAVLLSGGSSSGGTVAPAANPAVTDASWQTTVEW